MVDEEFCFEEEIHLTVRKSCLFFPGDGFVVYDPQGELIFRVDSYGPDFYSKDELVLMDSSGKCLLSLHHKKPSLHRQWEGFLGEKMDGQGPIFSMHRSSIIGRSDVVVEVYSDPAKEYQIEGSFSHRSCTIYYNDPKSPSKELAAEIKQKIDPTTQVMLGKDVFLLCLKPMVDGAFMMGLVLVLDQMVGDGDDGYGVERTIEDLSS